MQAYRPCAGIVVFNAAKKVLLCARRDKRLMAWQFPQGGIEPDETPTEAALRELYEETSIHSVKILKTLEMPLRYTFPPDPPEIQKAHHKQGIEYIGQEMFWSLVYFEGQESEINLETKEPEFKAWKWADFKEATQKIVHFKRKVYAEVEKQFTPFIEKY